MLSSDLFLDLLPGENLELHLLLNFLADSVVLGGLGTSASERLLLSDLALDGVFPGSTVGGFAGGDKGLVFGSVGAFGTFPLGGESGGFATTLDHLEVASSFFFLAEKDIVVVVDLGGGVVPCVRADVRRSVAEEASVRGAVRRR